MILQFRLKTVCMTIKTQWIGTFVPQKVVMNFLIMGKGMRIKHNLPPTNPHKVWVDFFLKEAFHEGQTFLGRSLWGKRGCSTWRTNKVSQTRFPVI